MEFVEIARLVSIPYCQYAVPRLKDLFAIGGQKFSKLDLSCVYQNVLLEAPSCKCVTIYTDKGLLSTQQFPFGVALAPVVFQQRKEKIYQGLPISFHSKISAEASVGTAVFSLNA